MIANVQSVFSHGADTNTVTVSKMEGFKYASSFSVNHAVLFCSTQMSFIGPLTSCDTESYVTETLVRIRRDVC